MFSKDDLVNFDFISDFKPSRLEYLIHYSLIPSDVDDKVVLRSKLASLLNKIKGLFETEASVKDSADIITAREAALAANKPL